MSTHVSRALMVDRFATGASVCVRDADDGDMPRGSHPRLRGRGLVPAVSSSADPQTLGGALCRADRRNLDVDELQDRLARIGPDVLAECGFALPAATHCKLTSWWIASARTWTCSPTGGTRTCSTGR